MNRLKSQFASKFIVLDGPDGCGKSTQLARLADRLSTDGLDVVTVRDPGTTRAGEAIRQIILSGAYGSLSPECELMLFMAARAQMVHEVIAPAIDRGQVVLADRFISASCAYQGAAGVPMEAVVRTGELAVRSVWPDLTIILDLPVETALARIHAAHAGRKLDAMERRPVEFHHRVRELFGKLTDIYPTPVVIIDAAGSVDEVHDRVMEALGRVDP